VYIVRIATRGASSLLILSLLLIPVALLIGFMIGFLMLVFFDSAISWLTLSVVAYKYLVCSNFVVHMCAYTYLGIRIKQVAQECGTAVEAIMSYVFYDLTSHIDFICADLNRPSRKKT
jgi:hypothetical protein